MAIDDTGFQMTQPTPQPLEASSADLLRIHPDDDVVIALRDIEPGERLVLDGESLTVQGAIPRGHKFAVRGLRTGEIVHKFGYPIGRVTADVAAGVHLHSHNLVTLLSGVDAYCFAPSPPPDLPTCALTFRGYRRADGRVGTRNEVWIIPTVGCVARTAQRIADIAHARHRGTIDGIHAFSHPYGCSQLGDDLDATRKLLAAVASHPNAGGVLLVGLGCESNQLASLMAEIPQAQRQRVRTVGAQDADDEIAEGLAAIDALVAQARVDERSTVPISELVIGLKCGGSDGFSGLTANPVVGRIADIVNGSGGSTVLTEIPEIFGAEHLLMARARDREVFDAVVEVVNDFKRYFLDHGMPVSENPSPGNIAGGITTLEEKSLGAVQKAGRATVSDVIRYGERVRRRGLTLLEAPGNDAISSTALAAAGATLILFTTGRGTPLGVMAPTLKIASNSVLADRKPGWTDFDAGKVLTQGFDATTTDLVASVLAVASGEPTAAETNNERELAIWKRGVSL